MGGWEERTEKKTVKERREGEVEGMGGWGGEAEGGLGWRELEISRLTIKTCLRGLKKKLC